MAVDVKQGDLVDVERIVSAEQWSKGSANGEAPTEDTCVDNLCLALADSPPGSKFVIHSDGSVVGVLVHPDTYAELRGLVQLKE